MPQGGLLQVDVEAAEIDGEYIRIHGYGQAGPYALISVTDTGSGMDQQMLEKIFEPFFTTKDVGKGTGLGLAIVYGIIKQHNGYINVYSEPGKGSTFKIYLPLIRDGIQNVPPPEPEHMLGGTETLLIAEDDDTLRDLICTVLREFGYKIIEARDGEEAVRKFEQNRDTVRLVILDVIMPGMSGKEAYDAIAEIQPRVKIIFQSGYPVDLMHRKGLPDSADHFLSKPISPRLLLKKVRQALDS
jgi:CheY-like chemotaxis protein